MSDQLFDYFVNALMPRGEPLAEQYQSAAPFPHIVLDDFLPAPIAKQMLALFPGADNPSFEQPDYKNHQVGKLGRVQDSYFAGVDPWLRTALAEFNSMPFLNFLEGLTGIRGLIPDPHFYGGAFHQILPGGKLNVHVDFNVDERRMLRRRINVLFYLNEDWQDDYGGKLELWDQQRNRCVVDIAPIFNRAVIFNTTSTSYHGHPQPLSCPEGKTRKSIALYYYSSDPVTADPEQWHTTTWLDD